MTNKERIYSWLETELGWIEKKLENQDDKSELDWRLTKIAAKLDEEGIVRYWTTKRLRRLPPMRGGSAWTWR